MSIDCNSPRWLKKLKPGRKYTAGRVTAKDLFYKSIEFIPYKQKALDKPMKVICKLENISARPEAIKRLENRRGPKKVINLRDQSLNTN